MSRIFNIQVICSDESITETRVLELVSASFAGGTEAISVEWSCNVGDLPQPGEAMTLGDDGDECEPWRVVKGHPDDHAAVDEGQQVDIESHEMSGIVATKVIVRHPRADRYGVPETASLNGARAYLGWMGVRVWKGLEVEAVDTGDDTCSKTVIHGIAAEGLLQELLGKAPKDGALRNMF